MVMERLAPWHTPQAQQPALLTQLSILLLTDLPHLLITQRFGQPPIAKDQLYLQVEQTFLRNQLHHLKQQYIQFLIRIV